MSTPLPTQPYRAPWPEAWAPQPPHRRAITLLAFSVFFFLLLGACAISAAVSADPGPAVLFALGALSFIAIIYGFWRRQVRVRARGTNGISWDADHRRLVIMDQHGVTWRPRTPKLYLSPEGLRREHGSVVETLAWAQIQQIRCGGETKDFSISVLAFAPGDRIRISGDCLAPDPALVAELLQFYLGHEGARTELGSTASLERVREGRFAQ